MRKRLYGLICVSFAVASSAFAGAVEWNKFYYGYGEGSVDPNVNVALGVWTKIGAVIVFLHEGRTGDNGYAILTASTTEWLASYGQRWRQFNEGDWVDYDAVFGNHDDYWLHLSYNVYTDRSVTIAQGGSIYLGFGLEGADMYGWVQLGFDGTSVYVINSAFDIGGDPIQVGLVPEPATGGLLFAGGVALLLLRKRRKPCRAENNEADCQNSFLSNSRNGGIT